MERRCVCFLVFAAFLPYGDLDCRDEANCRGELAIAGGDSCAILRIAENEMSEKSGESRMKLAVKAREST
jgi:hypothetical protein